MKRIFKKAKKYITTVIAGKTPKARKVRRNLLVVLGIVIFFIVLIFVLKGCNGKKANKQANEQTSTQYETRPHGTEPTTKEPTKKNDSTDKTEEDSSTETEKTRETSTNGSRSNGYSYGYSNTGSNKTPAPPIASDDSESGIRTPGENITSSQEPSIKVDLTVPNDPSVPTTKPTIPEVEPTTPAPSETPKRDDDESPYPSNDPTESTTPTPTEPSTPEPTEPTTPIPTEPTTPEPTTPTPTQPSVKEEPVISIGYTSGATKAHVYISNVNPGDEIWIYYKETWRVAKYTLTTNDGVYHYVVNVEDLLSSETTLIVEAGSSTSSKKLR